MEREKKLTKNILSTFSSHLVLSKTNLKICYLVLRGVSRTNRVNKAYDFLRRLQPGRLHGQDKRGVVAVVVLMLQHLHSSVYLLHNVKFFHRRAPTNSTRAINSIPSASTSSSIYHLQKLTLKLQL